MLGWFRRLQGSRAISSNKLVLNVRQAFEYGGSSVAEIHSRTNINNHQEEKTSSTLVVPCKRLHRVLYVIRHGPMSFYSNQSCCIILCLLYLHVCFFLSLSFSHFIQPELFLPTVHTWEFRLWDSAFLNHLETIWIIKDAIQNYFNQTECWHIYLKFIVKL